MKLLITLLSFLFWFSAVYAQPQFEILLEKEISELPFDIRVENDGIYGISSFDVSEDIVLIKSHDDKIVYRFGNNQLISQKRGGPTYDLIAGSDFAVPVIPSEANEEPYRYRKLFSGGEPRIFLDRHGILNDPSGSEIRVNVIDRQLLSIEFA